MQVQITKLTNSDPVYDVLYIGEDYYLVKSSGSIDRHGNIIAVEKIHCREYIRPPQVGDKVQVRPSGTSGWSLTTYDLLYIHSDATERFKYAVVAYGGDKPNSFRLENVRISGRDST